MTEILDLPVKVGESEEKDHLVLVWTSADKDVALKMVMMYAMNSKIRGWWDKVTLVIWGPSAKLASYDHDVQDRLMKLGEAGVDLLACKACSDSYGVSEMLEGMGVTVKYMGATLTTYLKEGTKVLTI